MNQSVMVFASTTARDADLTAPTEGMIVWLQDSNKYVYYTGSAWSDLITPASSGNAIINGAFEINQRNFSSTTTSGAFGFDRWSLEYSSGTATYSAQAFTPGAAPVAGYESTNFARLVTASQTGTSAYALLSQRIENVRTFAGETATVSFWAKASAGTPKIGVAYTQKFEGSTQVDANISDVTISTTWTRYTRTVTFPSLTGKTLGAGNNLRLMLFTSAGSDLSSWTSIGVQNETIDIWGVQLESGSTATAFKRNADNIQGELAACQRYYYRQGGLSLYQTFGFGAASDTSTLQATITFPVSMRTTPASIDYASLNANLGGSNITISSATLLSALSGNNAAQINATGCGN